MKRMQVGIMTRKASKFSASFLPEGFHWRSGLGVTWNPGIGKFFPKFLSSDKKPEPQKAARYKALLYSVSPNLKFVLLAKLLFICIVLIMRDLWEVKANADNTMILGTRIPHRGTTRNPQKDTETPRPQYRKNGISRV